jgi:hypothetical protein
VPVQLNEGAAMWVRANDPNIVGIDENLLSYRDAASWNGRIQKLHKLGHETSCFALSA